jgi:hypothetical protein
MVALRIIQLRPTDVAVVMTQVDTFYWIVFLRIPLADNRRVEYALSAVINERIIKTGTRKNKYNNYRCIKR